MKTKKIPLRKCVACQQMMPKKTLVRIVRTPEETVEIDLTGKKSGRGAYVCGNMACFQLAQKSRAFDRALKVPVSPEIYERLASEFSSVESNFSSVQERDANE
ncbi:MULTISPECIES: RNase P modulator RnpM [Paenibacillus]|uniref:Nucleic-acid-binding protein n=1 Tax=Paenibacillus bovis TaxID=1616788 RepID=A0A172ZGP6_9BACL|nr:MULTISPECIES: YlxR family protein [Paenibacillus]ANF96562.1 nucleic-acid-binding protein [Paenibacillus bovis]